MGFLLFVVYKLDENVCGLVSDFADDTKICEVVDNEDSVLMYTG